MHIEALESRRLLAVNLLSDAAGLSAANSVTINGTSYFFADNGSAGRELWKSDGTVAGTVPVKDLTPGAASSELVSIFHGADDRAVFLTVVHNPTVRGYGSDDFTLWSSDGTAGGTVKLQEFKASPGVMAKQLGDQVVIVAHDLSDLVPQGGGSYLDVHLWVTDGTAGKTKELKSFIASLGSTQGLDIDYESSAMYTAGGRVIFDLNTAGQLWSTDGTVAGTINFTSVLGDAKPDFQVKLDQLVQLDDKVLITSTGGVNKFWITDGTVAGTVSRDVTVQGIIEPVGDRNTVVNGKYVFVDNFGGGQKMVRSMDIASGEVTTIYSDLDRFEDPGSAHSISLFRAGVRLLMVDSSSSDFTTTVWTTDGTVDGTSKLATFTDWTRVYTPVQIGQTTFFVVAAGPFDQNVEAVDSDFVGWIAGSTGARLVNAAGVSSLELWRTDGTLANTGKVKTIWQGDANGRLVTASLSVADGKLLIRTQVQTGIDKIHYPSDPSKLTTEYDDTSAYDDKELTFGRQGASARFVNGVLRINGSIGDDRIRIWRSQRMPGRIVVEYNGNERSFNFSSIKTITADLQDGNDYFQILEGEGQVIKTKTSILGGDGSDTLIGASGHDTIYGGNSGDLIYGRGNADVIIAGGGRDRVDAGAGDDEVAGGSGVDQIVGGSGVDVFFGQNAVEMAFGEDVEGDDLVDDVFLG